MSITVSMATNILPTKTISKEVLDAMLLEHALWLKDNKQGKCIELRGYNLNKHDLSGTDLSYADFTGTSFLESKLCGTNFTCAKLHNATFDLADMSEAVLDEAELYGASICHANLANVSAIKANFASCIMWNSKLNEASMAGACFYTAQLCDCDFTSADLRFCDLCYSNIDYTCFEKADLGWANFTYAKKTFWANFGEADLTDVDFTDCCLADNAVNGAKGLFIPMACPEEGAFIAWKKCQDNRIVKLMVPENALRTGGDRFSCRASEVEILDIYSENNNCAEAVSFEDDYTFRRGETIKDKQVFDSSLLHDGAGIHFFLSRAEAENYEYHGSNAQNEQQEKDE